MFGLIKEWFRSKRDSNATVERNGRCVGRLTPAADVRDCQSQQGLVLLHSSKGLVYKSNGVAARIWKTVILENDMAGCVAGIARDYRVSPEEVERDVEAFLQGLVQAKLVTVGGRR